MADNKDVIINCPACGKPMKKIFMPEQGVNLDVCVDGCGGIYFDNREFSKFDEPHEDITPLIKLLKDKEFQKVDESQTRVCPVCGSDMVKNYSSSQQEIQVDECYHCGGKFLDFGELEKIREQYKTEGERSADVVKKLYKDVGKELIDAPLMSKSYKQQTGKSGGIVLGVLAALIWLIAKSSSIMAYFKSPDQNLTEFTIIIVVAICILAIFTGIGSLFGRYK
ncbi:zf-TFIIB domain-containing protein [bacterium]|nr:zf-TFIIB domain-containing protein [bacterium]